MYTVKLTEAEIAEKAQAMAQTGKRLFELDEMEDGVKADYKERIAEIKKERLAVSLQFKRLSRAVTLGVEERDGQQPLFQPPSFESITFSHMFAQAKTEPATEPEITADVRLCKCGHPKHRHEEGTGECEAIDCEPACQQWEQLLDKAEAELAAEKAIQPKWESRELTLDDYLAYAKSTGVKNPRKEATRWFESGELLADVRQFLKQQGE